MMERAVTFGDPHRLVGVVSDGRHSADDSAAPAVLLLNAGLLNRTGPHRLYVSMARALAGNGFLTLRFDHSGLGDSDRRSDQLPYAEAVVSDARMAMDHLAREYGIQRFILGGLCSGADHSFLTACQDSRVEGCILLDWYAYRTAGYYFRHYGPRLFRLGPWIRIQAKALQRLRSALPEKADRQVDPYARKIPPAAGVQRNLQDLLNRGVRFLCVYTGGQDSLINSAGQFFKMFPRLSPKEAIRVEYLRNAQHTFPVEVHRRELLHMVLDWTQGFGEGKPEEGEVPGAMDGPAP